MFAIEGPENDEIHVSGRFDAAQVEAAREVFERVGASCLIHADKLEYISSAGLSVLLETQQRLSAEGHRLRLRGLSPHVRLVFEYAGFDQIFDIE